MDNHNTLFKANPVAYTSMFAVNSVRWMMRNNHGHDGQRIGMLTHVKMGHFDLRWTNRGQNVVDLTVVNANAGGNDPPILAYWCPFIQGHGLPGYVDVPRRNPQTPFVFTAAMNGCALVATDSPQGAAYFRLYHHQHPNAQAVWNQINNLNQPVHSIVNWNDYANVVGGHGVANAFNFLYYRNSRWVYVLQPQILLPDLSVRLNPGVQRQILDVLP